MPGARRRLFMDRLMDTASTVDSRARQQRRSRSSRRRFALAADHRTQI
jgi:hypothetical protein